MERPFTEYAILLLLLFATATTTAATFGSNDNATYADNGNTNNAGRKFGAAPRMGGATPKTGGATPISGGETSRTDKATPKTGGATPIIGTNGTIPKTAGAAPKTGTGGAAAPKTGIETPKIGGASAPPVSLLPQEQEFVNAHNEVRYRNGLPPLKWDPKVAAYARWYAKRRSKDCAFVHSTGPFGENIFWGEGRTWTPKLAVEDWFEEHKYYNRQLHTCQSGRICAHYTQIIWRDTQKVGCGQVLCGPGNTYIVCSYEPPGNFQGKMPFEKHNPALYNQQDRLKKISLGDWEGHF